MEGRLYLFSERKQGFNMMVSQVLKCLHYLRCVGVIKEIDALKKSMGNKSQAARILGISRETVWNRMRKYNINPKMVLFS